MRGGGSHKDGRFEWEWGRSSSGLQSDPWNGGWGKRGVQKSSQRRTAGSCSFYFLYFYATFFLVIFYYNLLLIIYHISGLVTLYKNMSQMRLVLNLPLLVLFGYGETWWRYAFSQHTHTCIFIYGYKYCNIVCIYRIICYNISKLHTSFVLKCLSRHKLLSFRAFFNQWLGNNLSFSNTWCWNMVIILFCLKHIAFKCSNISQEISFLLY